MCVGPVRRGYTRRLGLRHRILRNALRGEREGVATGGSAGRDVGEFLDFAAANMAPLRHDEAVSKMGHPVLWLDQT